MYNAPAVTYPVERSRVHGAGVLTVGLLGGLALGLWLASSVGSSAWAVSPAADWRQGAMALVWVGTVLGAAIAWQRSPQGHLHWDGGRWEWAPAGMAAGLPVAQVTVYLDFQSWMLVRVQTQLGQTVWLWPECRTQEVLWDALRRAVFAGNGPGHTADGLRAPTASQDKA